MGKMWRLVTTVWLFISVLFTGFELFRCGEYAVGRVAAGYYSGYMWLGIGMIAFFLITFLLIRKNLGILQTMSHEGAHMIVSGLFLRKEIYEFKAVDTKMMGQDNVLGSVTSNMRSHNIFSSLAPYMFPYLVFLLLFFRLMIKDNCLPIIDLVVGIMLMFYITCWKRDIGRWQSDIIRCGIFRSYLFIISALMFNFAIIIYSLSYNHTGTINIIDANVLYFRQSWSDILWLISLLK
ncbi:MAG: hypothetical protein ACI358_05805 [Candidatus Limimorpha sp.]